MKTQLKRIFELAVQFVLPALLAASALPAAEQSGLASSHFELKSRLCDVNPNWSGKLPSQLDLVELGTATDEVSLLQMHFQLVLDRLNVADVDDLKDSQLEERHRNINRLREYMLRGEFPQNVFVAGRRPVFIDPWGVHCAVGHLIAVSGHADLAQQINREHRLNVLNDIQTKGLAEWQSASGLRMEELALIQPHYQFRLNSQTIQYPAELESLILGDSSAILKSLSNGELALDSRCGGKTLLHFAAAAGDLELVKRLVEMGADINAVSTLGCDEAVIANRGKHARFEIRWDAATQVTNEESRLQLGRVYQTTRGAYVADVLQDFFGGVAEKNALDFATAKPRPTASNAGRYMYRHKGIPNPSGKAVAGDNPLQRLKDDRSEVAKWLREQGLK
ncbi:MAG: ankyrin repeat domain-containing protein [Rhodopirellula sp. JB055]|uniref:ankyrin repeat domain-containing protein n=1 Tax=Rhodopirellula sp. JB055 TaxID=3342846 RepID=UPI00370A415D